MAEKQDPAPAENAADSEDSGDAAISNEKNAPRDAAASAPSLGGQRGRPGLLLALAIVGIVVTGAAFWGRHYLFELADPARFDGSPAPRPEINAPFITSANAVVERMVELADLSPDDMVYDLGCGDGRIVITASLRSGCRGVGIDIDPKLVALSIENAEKNGVADRVEFREQDVFTVDLTKADVAMMYLTPWMLAKLEKQFDAMRPGCKILTHDFWIEQVRPEAIVAVKTEESISAHLVFLYTTPLKRDPNMEVGKPPSDEGLAGR